MTGGKKIAPDSGSLSLERNRGQCTPNASPRSGFSSRKRHRAHLRRGHVCSCSALALGIVLAVASQDCTRALTLEPSGLSAGNLGQQTTPPDQKSNDSTAPATATGNPVQSSDSGKTTGNNGDPKNATKASIRSKTQKQKAAQNLAGNNAGGGASPIRNAAMLMLKSLDAAVGALQKPGILDPSSAQGKQLNDLVARRDRLRQKSPANGDDNAWADVASGAAAALGDAIQMMQARTANAASGTYNVANSRTGDRPLSQSTRLPLYVAGLALILSVLGLGSGWLIARHEVEKALTDAGLL